ncbi:MFS family permease [Pseudorhizobium tarimense]|uniref:MFS family permease n=1 Tax=Pseudorhizobium tarimense TaxID=1079109 RepID=A0ABV2H3M9_9HYPH|nr:MFS transporter [Pseudorhizobium tarimense]MCJ8518002.1 MFS transporter [Pseudorhizobium tarimense]
METCWSRVLIAVMGGAAAALHVGKVPPALPLLHEELGLDLVSAGWLMGLVSLMGSLLGLVVGRMADQLTHRCAMLLALSLLFVGSALGASSVGPWQLFASRIVESFGLILTVVAAPALITSATAPNDRGLAFAAWAGWLPVGVGAMMLASPLLLPTFGWRAAWIAAALATSVPLVALLAASSDGRSGGTASATIVEGATLTARLPTSWLLAGMFLLYSASFMSVFGFLPTMLIEDMGLTLARASLLTAFAVIANVPGNLLGGVLIRRGTPRWCLIVAAFSLLTLCAFVVFSPVLPLLLRYPAAILYAAAGGLLPAAIMSALPDYAARRDLVSTISGFVMQGTNIGQFLGPLLLATIVSRFGWTTAPAYVAATGLLGVILAMTFRHFERCALTT